MNIELIKVFVLSFSSQGRAIAAKQAKHQEAIMQVMCVLPGKHHHEHVEAAINAAGVYPRDIYESLAANQHTFVLARFFEALNGPA